MRNYFGWAGRTTRWRHNWKIKLLDFKLSCVILFPVPVCMPPDGADYTGKVATVSGWGRLKYGGGVPSVLQEVEVSEMREREFYITYMHINLSFMTCYKIQRLVKESFVKLKLTFVCMTSREIFLTQIGWIFSPSQSLEKA